MSDLKANVKKFRETIPTSKTNNLQLNSKVKQLSLEIEVKVEKIKFENVCSSCVVSNEKKMQSLISENQWLLCNYKMEQNILRSIKKNCVYRTETDIDREFFTKKTTADKEIRNYVLKS